mmetsp:Transcript_61186/g.167885  ORF Transcript_61186/g.167885 Transcript_61186/m.167885 type:complete len:111 (-) Transcript_61186:129-461(-)
MRRLLIRIGGSHQYKICVRSSWGCIASALKRIQHESADSKATHCFRDGSTVLRFHDARGSTYFRSGSRTRLQLHLDGRWTSNRSRGNHFRLVEKCIVDRTVPAVPPATAH